MGNIITFTSFKGGTGRTTTSVNIGYHLACMGKKVLIIDMDIDGPGVSTVANLPEHEVENKGIISYFKGNQPVSLKKFIISQNYENPRNFENDPTAQIKIDFLAAPMEMISKHSLDLVGNDLPVKMKDLAEESRKLYDYTILDAASGISDYSALSFAVSDHISACFKWSRQHLTGTMRLLSLLNNIWKDSRYPLCHYNALANAVPEAKSRLERERQRMVLDLLEESVTTLKSQNSERISNSEIGFIPIIREDNLLKWQEKIVTSYSDPFDDFKRYAIQCKRDLADADRRMAYG